jgi:hypothetical protein
VARFEMQGTELVVRLNLLEKVAAWRWRPRAPLSAITAVEVLTTTGSEVVDHLVRLGVVAAGAPLRRVATVGPRAKATDGRPAFVVTYMAGPAVLVRFDDTAPWALMLVSSRRARAVALAVRDSIPVQPG